MATLLEAVRHVSDVVAPGRCPVDSRGVLDAETVRAVNSAGRVLAKEGDWADLLANITFSTVDHRIVLPDFVTSIRAARVRDFHQQLRSPYYFHSQTGPGANPESHNIGDAGNLVHEGVFPVQHDLPGPTQLCVLFSEGAAPEIGKVTIVGANASRAPLHVELSGLMNGALVTTGHTFSEIHSVSKTATTSGLVRVMPWDEARGQYGFPVVTLSPWETSGNYRRYYLPGIPGGQEAEVLALVKLGWNREFVSAEERLPIGNLFAIRTMIQALRALDSANQKAYAELRALALGHMEKASGDVMKGQATEIVDKLTNRFTRRNGSLRRRRRF